MLKRILGIVAGLLVAGLVVMLVEGAGHMLFPPPAGTDLSDPAALAGIMESIPVGAKLAVVVAWFLGAFAGAFTALKISAWRWSGWIVALAIVAGGVYSMMTIPHPVWMMVAGVLSPLVAAWLAERTTRTI